MSCLEPFLYLGFFLLVFVCVIVVWAMVTWMGLPPDFGDIVATGLGFAFACVIVSIIGGTFQDFLPLPFARKLYRVPPPNITMEEALAIAKEECLKRGWVWDGDVFNSERLRDYQIIVQNTLGARPCLNISIHDGNILRAEQEHWR